MQPVPRKSNYASFPRQMCRSRFVARCGTGSTESRHFAGSHHCIKSHRHYLFIGDVSNRVIYGITQPGIAYRSLKKRPPHSRQPMSVGCLNPSLKSDTGNPSPGVLDSCSELATSACPGFTLRTIASTSLSRVSTTSSTLSDRVAERTGLQCIEDMRRSIDAPRVEQAALTKLKLIGQGAFGVLDYELRRLEHAEVHRAELDTGTSSGSCSPTGQPSLVAVKRMKGGIHPEEVAGFVGEIQLLTRLRHDNIIQCVGVGVSPSALDAQDCDNWPDVFMVQEFASSGSLRSVMMHQMVQMTKPVYTFTDALRWSVQIAEGVAFLHSLDPLIIHRDLKPDNILLTGPKGQLVAKVADFGLHAQVPKQNTSSAFDELTRYALTGQTGAMCYMAPEVLLGRPYAEKVDVFALGVIMYELFSKVLISTKLHKGSDGVDPAYTYACKVAAGYRESFPAYVPSSVCDLISRCWASLPELRPAMSEVVAALKGIEALGVVESMSLSKRARTNTGKSKCTIM